MQQFCSLLSCEAFTDSWRTERNSIMKYSQHHELQHYTTQPASWVFRVHHRQNLVWTRCKAHRGIGSVYDASNITQCYTKANLSTLFNKHSHVAERSETTHILQASRWCAITKLRHLAQNFCRRPRVLFNQVMRSSKDLHQAHLFKRMAWGKKRQGKKRNIRYQGRYHLLCKFCSVPCKKENAWYTIC